MVASAVLWIWILDPMYGIVNRILSIVGIDGPTWFQSATWSKPSLILMGLWGIGYTMIIYLAGLQDISEQIYEAAELDGANFLHKFRHITIPMMTPVTFFVLITSLIGIFQYFVPAYVITQGGPYNSTLFYQLYMYNIAWRDLRMGYGAMLGLVLFAIVLSLTLIVFKSGKRWVYYGES